MNEVFRHEYPSLGLYPVSGSNSHYHLLREIWLHSLPSEYNSNRAAEELSKLNLRIEYNDDVWRTVSRVLGSPGLRRVAFHVLETGAVTLLIARLSLGFSLGSAVRYLEDLRSFGVLRPAVKLLRPAGVRGGRRVVVYVVPGVEGKQVEAACALHRRLENPLYLRALEVAEELIYIPRRGGEVTYVEVVETVKTSCVASDVPGMAETVVRILVERGVKIWR